jgi:hypothetical protein
MEIKYLTNDTIDKGKWDVCIANAANSLIYAYSFYLDTMAQNWDALIVNDYEIVMPLAWNKKYGISYLYQPFFTQQLGPFSKYPITETTGHTLGEFIKNKFRFAEIFINTEKISSETKHHANFTLALDSPYQIIRSGYSSDLIKNLKHASKFSLSYVASENYIEAINAYIKEYAIRMPHVKKTHYERLKKLCSILLEKNLLIVRKILSEKDQLLAIAIFLKDKNRIYNILSTVLPDGKTTEANHFLFDELIKEFAEKEKILDFEGSDIEGIASFYKKFGALNEPYYLLRYNNLPWPFNYLKR